MAPNSKVRNWPGFLGGCLFFVRRLMMVRPCYFRCISSSCIRTRRGKVSCPTFHILFESMVSRSSPSTEIYYFESHPRVQVAAPICDPLFSPAGADMTLRSLEGTLYRVHTPMLRSNSGFFNTLLSLPQTDMQQENGGPVIPSGLEAILDVYENDFPVKTLLCLMSGILVPRWETIDAFERILHLAEKWDTPGPIDFLRSALVAHQFIENYPLRCYRLATHFNWGAEAKLASSHSLTLDIFNPIHRDTLDQLSSMDLLSLFNLHRERQVMFRELLHCPERFVAGNRSVTQLLSSCTTEYLLHCLQSSFLLSALRCHRTR
jgi:hypothetical protein